MSRFSDLRAELLQVQGPTCAMPSCDEPWTDTAHIVGSGMGGRPSTYVIENLVGLDASCHAIFDGRTMQGRQSMLRELMRYMVNNEREKL